MKRGTLILLCGFAGAGKTTMAKRLVESFGYARISTDEVNDRLRATSGKSFAETSPLAHDTAWAAVRAGLDAGETVVMDTNMCSNRAWTNIDLLTESTHRLILLLLSCSLEEHKRRIDHRGETQPEHLNLGGQSFEETLHKYAYLRDLERGDVTMVDANDSIEEVFERILSTLKRQGLDL